MTTTTLEPARARTLESRLTLYAQTNVGRPFAPNADPKGAAEIARQRARQLTEQADRDAEEIRADTRITETERAEELAELDSVRQDARDYLTLAETYDARED